MMRQYRFFVVILVLLLMLLTACGQADPSSAQSTATPAASVSEPEASPMPSPTQSASPIATTPPEATPEATAEPTPEPTPEVTPKATPKATQKPEKTPEPTPEQPRKQAVVSEPKNATGTPLSGLVIGIDPGHQAHSNSDPEPVAPGSDETKKKVSSGTQGRFTDVAEYKVNLKVGLTLKQKLTDLGAKVVMTRESHDVDISNSERAVMMNEAGADLVVRLHCNGSDNASKHGAVALIPSNDCTADINGPSKAAAKCIIRAFSAATGAKDLGLQSRSDQTGFNWSTVPVCNIEMGYMTNEEEDRLLVTDEYQEKCAQGIANGIAEYFG